MNTAVGGEINFGAALGAGEADIGEAALFLQPGTAIVIKRALVRKQALLPARQENRLELQPLGPMQRHDRHTLAAIGIALVHHQRNMFEEGGEVFKLLHRADKLFQVLKPASSVGGAVLFPEIGIAGFLQYRLRQLVMRHRVKRLAPARKIIEQRAQRLARPGFQFFGFHQHARRQHQRNALRARKTVQRLQRRVAKAAFWHIDDALKRQIIGRLRHAAQIGQRVAHLQPLIKARPADDLVGQAERDEALLKFAHLERSAHQNGDLVKRMLLVLQLLDVFADKPRLLLRVPHAGDDRLLAQRIVGEQRLAEPPFIMGNQRRSGGKNMAGGAVVALKADHLRARKILVEAQDVIDLRTAPAINRLIVVADTADIRAALRQQAQPHILNDVGVLIFIDQNIFETFLIQPQHVRIFPQKPHAFQQQVAEIGGIQDFQPLLVQRIELAALAIGERLRLARRHARRVKPAILPRVDLMREGAGGPALVVDVLGFQNLLHQPDLVVGVENGEGRFQANQFGVAAQYFRGNGMECAQPRHALRHRAGQVRDTFLHLARGLVGEGDGENFMGAGAGGGDDVGDAGGEHARLAGARPCQHQHRAVHRLNRLALLGVQPRHIGRPASRGSPGARGDAALTQGRAVGKQVVGGDGQWALQLNSPAH